MSEETPILGPVTVTFQPAAAAELAMVIQHVLHNVPEDPRPDQAARAHTLGEAAIALSNALVQAMHDAGLSDEMIARASGRIMLAAPEANAAQLTIAPEPEPDELTESSPSGEEMTGPHPLDQPSEPHNPSPPVDFPAPGGPPNAA